MKDKIYYCNITGEILLILASLVNVKETSFDEDYLIYSALNKRTKNSISLIELDFGEFSKLSQGSTDIIVDLRTKELIFSYEELPTPPQEPTEIEIIQNKISILEQNNQELREELNQIQNSIAALITTTIEK